MTAVSFTGLASGLDTSSLVTQLVAAERAPAQAIAQKQSDLNTQKSIVNSLSTALAALGSSVTAMTGPNALQPRTVTSSDAHVTVTASSGAAATVHDVRVEQLARGQITASRTFGSAAAGQLGDGSLQITSGGTTQTINYGATDSLADIASKINGANAGASASVLFDGTSYRLMVAATATGTAAAPQFVDSGDALGLADPANIKIAAQDAKAVIDGVEVVRGSNVISDAVQGLSVTLVSPQATGEASSQVAVSLDNTAITTKLNAMVAAYNSVNGALHVQLDYTGTKKGTNTLFGDSALRQLQGALAGVMSSGYGTDKTNTLSAIGLSRDKSGNLTLDSTKLSAALAKDPDAVNKLFQTDGFGKAVTTLSDAYTRSDGILASKTKSMADRFTVLQRQADQINDRADALQTQLEKQFTALETAMSTLKSQASFLTSALG